MELLTVGQLTKIVDSQVCIYGNKALFLKVAIEHNETFQLFSGSSTEQPILECVSYGDHCVDDGGSQALLTRLLELDASEIIYCSDDTKINDGFSIGFKSSVDGFVETINSTELIQPTFVQ